VNSELKWVKVFRNRKKYVYIVSTMNFWRLLTGYKTITAAAGCIDVQCRVVNGNGCQHATSTLACTFMTSDWLASEAIYVCRLLHHR